MNSDRGNGGYFFVIYSTEKPLDLRLDNWDRSLGDWELGVKVQPGERKELNPALKPVLHVSGTVHSLDTNQPLSGILVQAMRVSSSESQPAQPEYFRGGRDASSDDS